MTEERSTLRVRLTRDGKWWFAELVDMHGGCTQGATVREALEMSVDLAAMMTGRDAESFIPQAVFADDELQRAISGAHRAREAAAQAASRADAAFAEALDAALTSGLPYRDIAVALGVSHQRVGQLAARRRAGDEPLAS